MLKRKTKIYRLSAALGIIFSGALTAAPVWANNQDSDNYFQGTPERLKKWTGHVQIEFKKGNHRNIGETEFFIPITQSDDDLLFLDIRGMLDNKGSEEGNFGLGYRTILDAPILGQQWIFGSYGFIDVRDTPADNKFYQLTLGAEMLSEDWDFRTNIYIPEASDQQIRGSAVVSGVVTGTQLRLVGSGNLRERALRGADIEMGYKLPVFEEVIDAVRVYGGGFHFYASGYDNVTGPRGRMELSWDDIPAFDTGSRFTLGGEMQHDDVRGRTAFGIARLRIPFQTFNENLTPAAKLTPLEKRMTERIVRDVDIVSGQNKTPELVDEVASITINGVTTSNVTILDATDNVPAGVTAAGAAATIIIDGSLGDINLAATILPLQDQIISGGGVIIRGTSSGLTGTLGTRPTINGAPSMESFQTNFGSDNVTLQNMDLNIFGNNARGIFDFFATGLTVDNITIQGDGSTNSTGVLLAFSIDTLVSNVSVDGAFRGIHVAGTSNATVSDSVIANAVSDGVFVEENCFFGCVNNTNTTLNNVSVFDAGASSFRLGTNVVNATGTSNSSSSPAGAHCQNDDAGNTGTLEVNSSICP